MGKKRQNSNLNSTPNDSGSSKNWQQIELLETFGLTRINSYQTPLMKEWLDVQPPELNVHEQYFFDYLYELALENMDSWSEEDLKVKFISHVLLLGHIKDDATNRVIGFFDKMISATVGNILLRVKSDYMFARGRMNICDTPYFHFQEYKPYLNPTGESMAQLLEAFLIAQVKNKNGKPLYGVEIVGKHWTFVTMEGKEYCISNTYEATKKNDLLSIIAILRKFRAILYERLLD
jgi:hypothetical protein